MFECKKESWRAGYMEAGRKENPTWDGIAEGAVAPYDDDDESKTLESVGSVMRKDTLSKNIRSQPRVSSFLHD